MRSTRGSCTRPGCIGGDFDLYEPDRLPFIRGAQAFGPGDSFLSASSIPMPIERRHGYYQEQGANSAQFEKKPGYSHVKAPELANQLSQIATTDDFPSQSSRLVESWKQAGTGPEALEPVLRFMEAHPDIDYGMPGSLVHFVETFFRKGYEAKLVESIVRKPTAHTVWMLNRLINGTQGHEQSRYIQLMEAARTHPLTDSRVAAEIDEFLGRS